MLDKIFKNNMIMGVVAIATLVLVGIMFWRAQESKDDEPCTGKDCGKESNE